MNNMDCSKGWEDRCVTGTSDICRCECKGENHGKKTKSKRAKELRMKIEAKKEE